MLSVGKIPSVFAQDPRIWNRSKMRKVGKEGRTSTVNDYRGTYSEKLFGRAREKRVKGFLRPLRNFHSGRTVVRGFSTHCSPDIFFPPPPRNFLSDLICGLLAPRSSTIHWAKVNLSKRCPTSPSPFSVRKHSSPFNRRI